MAKDTCSVDDCEKAVKRLGLCYGHYMKQWRYGTPTPQLADRYTDITGQRFGLLVVVRRIGAQWLCACDCGAPRLIRAGDLNRGSAVHCGGSTHRWAPSPGYTAAHDRVKRRHGSASQHPCTDCGLPAAHWSYDHADPAELRTADGHAYSTDPQHYAPRCVSCHKRFDLTHLTATP